ncbi:5-hydroxytryptamine receptor 3A-like isoform 2-T2 [Leptodactylus fuscus]|uniref:5-hydroxytryptamine receptor 3A-like isoform X2 n=1 Tax=Leptodactylus fuscus TaxID=238119 RepID=UPI003F4E592E
MKKDNLPGALLHQTCKQYDVIEYLNITEREHQLLMTMPKNDWTKPLIITVDIVFISILAVVEKTQTITTYFWIYLTWKNDFLSWDPEQFCNISHTTIPLSYFWVPDLYYVEQVIEDSTSWMKYANLSHDGTITAVKPTHLSSTCILDFYYFPFDVQTCSVTLISAMHKENSLILTSQKNSSDVNSERLKYFVDNGEWHPLEVTVEYKPQDGYSRLLYTATIQRESSLYILALILPSMALLVLDLLSNFVPKAYNEKIGFKITLLLGISVLMLLLNDFLPASSDQPPIIVIFFIGTMSLMAIGIVETIFITYIGGRTQKSDKTAAGTFPLYQGLLLKSSCNEDELKEEEPVPEDGVASALEKICRDMHMVRQQILSLQRKENLEAEREKFQERIEKFVFYGHTVLVITFYMLVFFKWKW